MAKLQREINPLKMEQAKQRTIDNVMQQIQPSPKPSIWRILLRPVLVPTLILAIVLVILFAPRGNTPDDDGVVLSAHNTQKLAELSYLSSSFVGADWTVMSPSFQFLADGETEFEKEDSIINLYFDTLRVYLEDVNFTQVVQTQELEDSTFDYLITFDLHDQAYEFYLSIDDSDIIGELMINGVTYDVTGSMEESSTETKFELEAVNGSNYVHIKYKYESEDDIESKYEVDTRINGIETSREIKVSFEADEAKVEISEGDNEYTLKRETEDGVTSYKLEYEINGVEGEARIHETVDANGNSVFQYSVKEGNVEKDIERGRPNYDYDDEDDEDDDSPGRGNQNKDDDDEDEEDDEFTSNQQQPYDTIMRKNIKNL